MTLPRTVSDVVAEHTVFEIECIDRMYLNVYVPQLQYAAGIVGYVHRQLGLPIASTAPLGKITDAFSAAMRRFAVDQGVPWVNFVKGQRKDEVMHQHLTRFEAENRTEGVLFIGRAQEKTTLFRTEKRRDAEGRSYPWIVRTTGFVNHFYVYAVDADFGPFFLKFCSYFPYNAKLCLNGNEWAKKQAAQAGIGFTALDNAFAAIDDPADVAAIQAICGSLGPEQIDALLRKWLARVPHPFSPADRTAGYRYDVSILQAEFSLTQMLDRPVSGRIFFEQVIRGNLDLGRPDQVSLVFNRRLMRTGPRATPGRFRTRVITKGVTPSLHVDYKHTTIKQYHKEGRALRTETTINDTYDFDIRKRLTNLPALCEVGFTANRRLLDVQTLSHDPARGQETFTAINDPVFTDQGTRVAGLRFADARAQAVLQALLVFRLLPNGFTNRDLRQLVGQLLDTTMSAGQLTYDLRRLRTHGLITRLPHSHRYHVTDTGLHDALFLTRVHDRLLRTGLAELTDAEPGPLRAASRAYEKALDRLTRESGLAAGNLTQESGFAAPSPLAVVLATLVVQGLTLAPLTRRLGVGVGVDDDDEVTELRQRAAQAALDQLRRDDSSGVFAEVSRAARLQYEGYLAAQGAMAEARAQGDEDSAGRDQLRALLGRAATIERSLVLEARRRGEVSPASADEVLRDIEGRALRDF